MTEAYAWECLELAAEYRSGRLRIPASKIIDEIDLSDFDPWMSEQRLTDYLKAKLAHAENVALARAEYA